MMQNPIQKPLNTSSIAIFAFVRAIKKQYKMLKNERRKIWNQYADTSELGRSVNFKQRFYFW